MTLGDIDGDDRRGMRDGVVADAASLPAVVAARDRGLTLWQANGGDEASRAVAHRVRPLLGRVTVIDYAAGQLAAAGGRVCCVWSTRSHALLLRLVVAEPIGALVLSKNGLWLGLAIGDRVQIICLPRGEPLLEYEHAAPVQSVHIAANSPFVASADTRGEVQVRALECGSEVWRHQGNPGRSIVFLHHTGRPLAVDGDAGTQLFDIDGTHDPMTFRYSDEDPTQPITKRLNKALLTYRGRSLRLFDYADPQCRCARRIDVADEVTSIDISADDTTFLATTRGGAIQLFELYGARQLASFESFTNPLLAARFGVGRTVYAAGGEALVMQIDQTRHERSYYDESPPIVSAAWCGTRHAILITDRDGGVSRHDLRDGRRTDFVGHAGSVSTIACDGDHVVTGAYDGTARLWRDDGRLLATISPGDGPVQAVAHDAGRNTLWVGTWGGQVIAFDLRTSVGTLVCKLPESIRSICLDRDGRRMAVGDNDGHFAVHDLEGGARQILASRVQGPAYRARFDVDGSVVVTSAEGLRRLAPGLAPGLVAYPCEDPRWFDTLPDGNFCVLGLGGRLDICDPHTQRRTREVSIDEPRRHRVVFGVGDRIFTGSADGCLRVFDAALTQVAELQRLRRGVLWTTTPTGAHPGWLFTDRPELVRVSQMRDGTSAEWGDDDPRRVRHLAAFNSATHTMAIVAGSIAKGPGMPPHGRSRWKPTTALCLTYRMNEEKSGRA